MSFRGFFEGCIKTIKQTETQLIIVLQQIATHLANIDGKLAQINSRLSHISTNTRR